MTTGTKRPLKANQAAGQIGTGTSKLARLTALLRQSSGASLDDMMKVTGWQAHSVRGALAGALKKRGHIISSMKEDGVRRYRIGTLK